MATAQQAQTAFDNSRNFFSASDGALKSNNKAYIDKHDEEGEKAAKTLAKAKGISKEEALQRVQRRAMNRLQAQPRGKYWTVVAGLTPVEYGRLTVSKGAPTGNCGLMSCVAMHFASLVNVPVTEMWMVTVRNASIKISKSSTVSMDFGHSYALLGTGQGQEFIVDPWAGVCCAKEDYAKALKRKLKDWHEKGKRILVNWDNGAAYWLPANHDSVLSLLKDSATTERMRGDETF